MTSFKSIALIGATVFTLSACATTPDPAKVCSADWISTRSGKALDRIETRSKSSMKALQKAGESWSRGKTPGPLQLLALSSSMNRLKKELTNGQGIKDLRTLSSTCNDPDIIKTAMNDLIDRQDFSDEFKTMIDNNPIFQSLIQSLIESAQNIPETQT